MSRYRERMQQRYVGRTGLKVSRLGLGTLTWGRDTDEHEAREQLVAYTEAGGNFVDAAAGYGSGASEEALGALLGILDPDSIEDWKKEAGASGDYAEAVADPKTQQMVQGYVDTLNSQLNRWETIKKFELLDHDLSVESGELTPSMKVKRNVVEDNYADHIAKLYA